MSFVDVSESIVIRLKVTSTAERSAASHASGVSGASVVTNASIVAMFGMIMPAPLAMPPTVKRRPSHSHDSAVCFAKVSVVMMASAASSPSALSSASTASGSAPTTSSTGSGTPITPVEATMTSEASHSRSSATAAAVARASSTPLRARARVRVASVDHDCPDASVRDVLAGEQHRRRGHRVQREDGGGRYRLLGGDQRDVALPSPLSPAETPDDKEALGRRRRRLLRSRNRVSVIARVPYTTARAGRAPRSPRDPNTTFAHCIAWPDEPLIRLSIAHATMSMPVRSSTATPM